MTLLEKIQPEDSRRAVRLTKAERIEQIRQAKESGASTAREIAERVGVSIYIVYSYANKAGIKLSNPYRGKIYGQEAVENVRRAVEDGTDSINAIREKTGYGYITIKKYASQGGIELPRGKHGRKRMTRPELDALVEEGSTLQEIGGRYGVSRERARQIISNSGRRELWKERRKEKKLAHKTERAAEEKRKHENLQEIAWILDRRAEELAKQEGWEYEKAVEYINKPKKIMGNRLRTHTFDELVTLFRKYKNTQNSGERLSLYELTEGTGFASSHVGKILADVGLEPMYWKIENRQVTPGHKKEAIRRAVNVKMPAPDIAYFLGLNEWTVHNNFVYFGLNGKRPKVSNMVKAFGRGPILTYRLASEIYEGRYRCKFSRDEISQVLGLDRKLVDYTLGHEKSISRNIVRALRILYDDKEINQPYKKSDF